MLSSVVILSVYACGGDDESKPPGGTPDASAGTGGSGRGGSAGTSATGGSSGAASGGASGNAGSGGGSGSAGEDAAAGSGGASGGTAGASGTGGTADAAGGSGGSAGDAGTRTSVRLTIPTFSEKNGLVSEASGNSDTWLKFFYTGGIGGLADTSNAQVDVYLYGNDGQPLSSATGGAVCNPCSYTVSAASRAAELRIEDKIDAAGGFASASATSTGFGVIVIDSVNPDAVAVLGHKETSLSTTVGDVVQEPLQIVSMQAPASRYVTAAMQQQSATGPVALSSRFHFANVGGLAGAPAIAPATVKLQLFGADGLPLQGSGGPVCGAGCEATLDGTARTHTFDMTSLLASAGAPSAARIFTVIDVTGASGSVAGIAEVQSVPPGPPGATTTPLPLERLRAASITEPMYLVQPHLTNFGLPALETTSFAGVAGIPGDTGSIEYYLYDAKTNAPLLSPTAVEICNPCTASLDQGVKSSDLGALTTFTTSKGGLPRPGSADIYSITKVTGSAAAVTFQNANQVLIPGFMTYAITPSFDRAQTITSAQARRTFVLPHVLEVAGLTTDVEFTFDTVVNIVYTGGQAGSTGGGGATVNVYLFNATGGVMTGTDGQQVCNPCGMNFGSTERKKTFSLVERLDPHGGAPALKTGYAVLTVSGADPGGVSLQGFVVNQTDARFDLSVFGFSPFPIAAAASTN